MMKNYFRNDLGMALPIVIILTTIITLLAFTASFVTQSQSTMVGHYSNQEEALYYAEAGFNQYLYYLNNDRSYWRSDDALNNEEIIEFEDGFFRLEVELPEINDDETIFTIRSTGWTADNPTIRRTVEVGINKREFFQSIYGSNFEKTPPNGGSIVYWISDDQLFGPLHTNDKLNINGNPTFYGKVTYAGANPDSGGTYRHSDNSSGPIKVDPLIFPNTNADLSIWAKQSNLYFEGRTCIYIDGNQLKIRKRDGSIINHEIAGDTVVYVDDVEGTSGTDKWNLNVGNAFVSGKLDGRLTIAVANNIYITGWDPTNWEEPQLNSSNNPRRIPRGVETGGLTYTNTGFSLNKSNGTVSVTGSGNDMLGLVAERYIYILHNGWPRAGNNLNWSWSNNDDVAPFNINIHASIFALNQGFTYETYDTGTLKGTIQVMGSITQNYRGAMGTFNPSTGNRATGYAKTYAHDPRMGFDMPPRFLEPTNSGWEIQFWREAPNPIF